MLASYILRVVPTAAADGRIVGELESVVTGQIRTIRTVDELVTLVCSDQQPVAPARPEALS